MFHYRYLLFCSSMILSSIIILFPAASKGAVFSQSTDQTSFASDKGVPTPVQVRSNSLASCPDMTGEIDLWDQVNCLGNRYRARTGPGLYDLIYTFNDKARSIAIPRGWSAMLYKNNAISGPRVCLNSTTQDLSTIHYSDGSSASGSLTFLVVYNQSSCAGITYPPEPPSNPTPLDNATVGRTNDTTFYWTTQGGSCDIHIWGGPGVNTITTGIACSSFHWGSQLPGAYLWQVTARNAGGMTAGPAWRLNIQPYPPADLQAFSKAQTQIELQWTKSVDDPGGVDQYKVYFSDGTFVTIVNSGAASTSIPGLACGTLYAFYLTSVRQGVESEPSDLAGTSTLSCGNPPGEPSDPAPLNEATVARMNDTTFSWSTDGDTCDIHIWGGPGVDTRQAGVSCSSFHWGNQQPGLYNWQVTAHNIYSSTIGPTWRLKVQPAPPSGLTAAPATQAQIELSWIGSSDDPGNIDQYDVYFDDGTLVTTLPAGAAHTTITGLSCSSLYSFYVTAVRQAVTSEASNTVEAATLPCTLSLESIYTADQAGIPESIFIKGEEIRSFAYILNNTGSSQQATLSWVIDGGPCGTIASSAGEMAMPVGSSYWFISISVNEPICSGTYHFTVTLVYNGQTTTKSIDFTVLAYESYLPLARRE
jgi:hypothetical protein